jgi:3-(3-hydroxy-phenyl)propionate hydroxylase
MTARAPATTHAATLEILENLGLVEEVTRRGLIEPKFRIWDRASRAIIASSISEY